MAIQAVSITADVEETVYGPIANPRYLEEQVRDVVQTRLIEAPDTRSGATYVQMLLHAYQQRRWVITINVGDSEALLVDSKTVLQCSVAHNWDNYDVYRRYASVVSAPRNVCYNRWNASSKYRTSGPEGLYEPIMLYDALYRPDMATAAFVQQKMARRNYPYGTQSIRMPTYAYENWGSCVCVDNKALGQLVACYGDKDEREKTGVPYDMVHVYIHELAADDDVYAIVQSDGVSNSMTLQQCGFRASVTNYLPEKSKDDMSVVRAHWRPKRNIPCPKK
jgi:serine/threonine protein phosphatase PrpC